jgi:hypothetical protein
MPDMVDEVAEKTRSIIDAARARRSGADVDGTTAASSGTAPSPAASTTLPVDDDVDVPEAELVPAAVAPVVSASRRVFSLLLLVIIGVAGGIAVGTGILAAITWISDALLDSFT